MDEQVSDFLKHFDEDMAAISKSMLPALAEMNRAINKWVVSFENQMRAINKWAVSFENQMRPIVTQITTSLTWFAVIQAPQSLACKTRNGKNLYRGKARRRLKLLRSQYRRGVLQ